MINLLKGEIYKLFHQKIFLLLGIILFNYGILANLIYYFTNLTYLDLWHNFLNEYLLIYLILIIFLAVNIIYEEYNDGTIIDLANYKIINIKIIILFFLLIYIFILSVVLNYLVSIIVFHNFKLDIVILKNIIISFIKLMPYLIFYCLLSINLAIIFRSSGLALTCSFSFYFLSEYLNNLIITHGYQNLYFLSIYNLNFNKHILINNVSYIYSLSFNIILLAFLILFANFIFDVMKKKI